MEILTKDMNKLPIYFSFEPIGKLECSIGNLNSAMVINIDKYNVIYPDTNMKYKRIAINSIIQESINNAIKNKKYNYIIYTHSNFNMSIVDSFKQTDFINENISSYNFIDYQSMKHKNLYMSFDSVIFMNRFRKISI